MSNFFDVASTSDLADHPILGVEVNGFELVLVKKDNEYFALEDNCPHEGAPLSEGYIEGEEIVCLWHGSCFHLRTGKVRFDPATEDIAVYQVRVVNDRIEVELPDPA